MSNSTAQKLTAGRPIPTPPDFSVVWTDPRDAKLTWMTIPQYKTPISPLIHSETRTLVLQSSFEKPRGVSSLGIVKGTILWEGYQTMLTIMADLVPYQFWM